MIKPLKWYDNMITKKQLKILEVFRENIFREYSYKEIGQRAKEKSNNTLQKAIRQFLKEKIVIEKKVGTSKLYSINTENEKVYDYLALLKFEGLPKEVAYSIKELIKEIEEYTLFYSLVIFGSYADGKYTNKSDLDVCILIPEKSLEKDIKIALNMASNKSLLKLDPYIFTLDEFLQMLKDKSENLGKQIARKHKAIQNINIFYKFVKKGMENGFKY